jgi:Kef-type K+ transport system membrane component KefB
LISLALLLFAAKLFAELFHKFKIPVVLGELFAGIIVGPYAIGALPIFEGKPLVILNETVLQIGEIAGIVILFIAGLNYSKGVLEGRRSFIYNRCMRSYCSVLFRLLYVYTIWIAGLTVHFSCYSPYSN